jgi:uncharacterized protein YecE (DUF72 family)
MTGIMPTMTARILVGTCSWTDPTLIACGRFYPRHVTSAEARLRFYAAHFPIVEVDSTYYAPPDERNSVLWAKRTPVGFTFDIKAFALLTGHAARLERLPPPLRDLLPEDVARRPSIYLKHVPEQIVELLWEAHRRALAPLAEAGKLGALLFQFPPWFTKNRGNVEYVRSLADRLPGSSVAVEFRGGGWMEGEHAASTLAILESAGLAYVSVDEPQGFASSTPPVAAATADLAYVRLHGRNAGTWTASTRVASDRFNYLYSEAELAEWVPRVRALAEQARELHVLFNNNYQDVGVRNARQMAALLDVELETGGDGGDAPGSLTGQSEAAPGGAPAAPGEAAAPDPPEGQTKFFD